MAEAQLFNEPSSTQQHYKVTRADLPLSCPTRHMRLWDGHPQVYLPIEKVGTAVCPYCNAQYTLVEQPVNPECND